MKTRVLFVSLFIFASAFAAAPLAHADCTVTNVSSTQQVATCASSAEAQAWLSSCTGQKATRSTIGSSDYSASCTSGASASSVGANGCAIGSSPGGDFGGCVPDTTANSAASAAPQSAPNTTPVQSAPNTTVSPNTTSNVTLINPLGSGTNNIETFINQILAFVVRIGSIIVILMLVYVGFLFVKARGEPAKITEARKALLYTIIGALILLGAQVISLGIQATVQALSTGDTSSGTTNTGASVPSTTGLGQTNLFPGASTSGGTIMGGSTVSPTAAQMQSYTAMNQAQSAFTSACSQFGNTSSQCKAAGSTLQQASNALNMAVGGVMSLGGITSAINAVISGKGPLSGVSSAFDSLKSGVSSLFGSDVTGTGSSDAGASFGTPDYTGDGTDGTTIGSDVTGTGESDPGVSQTPDYTDSGDTSTYDYSGDSGAWADSSGGDVYSGE